MAAKLSRQEQLENELTEKLQPFVEEYRLNHQPFDSL
jgi:hypothetical protein